MIVDVGGNECDVVSGGNQFISRIKYCAMEFEERHLTKAGCPRAGLKTMLASHFDLQEVHDKAEIMLSFLACVVINLCTKTGAPSIPGVFPAGAIIDGSKCATTRIMVLFCMTSQQIM